MEEKEGWEYLLVWIDEVFMNLIDSETGSFLHYPHDGSYLQQNKNIMLILERIQYWYRKAKYERRPSIL